VARSGQAHAPTPLRGHAAHVVYLHSSFGWGRHRKHPTQKKMGRPIEKRNSSDENHGDVDWCGPPRTVEKWILIDIVHVERWRQKPRDDEKRGGDCGLNGEGAAVVTNFFHGPEERQRKGQMKAGEQARPERY